jgi:hypothetical protein
MPEYQRKLPHFHPDDTWLFLTWRLKGSMPAKADYIIYPTPSQALALWSHDPECDPEKQRRQTKSSAAPASRSGRRSPWNHYLRSAAQIDRTKAYIEQNPVSAGLIGSAESWRWSSAGWQAKPPILPKPPGLEVTVYSGRQFFLPQSPRTPPLPAASTRPPRTPPESAPVKA